LARRGGKERKIRIIFGSQKFSVEDYDIESPKTNSVACGRGFFGISGFKPWIQGAK